MDGALVIETVKADALTLVDRRTEPSDRYFRVYDLNAESDRTCIRATAV